MKKNLLLVLLMLAVCLHYKLSAQNSEGTYHYLVIGGFAQLDNAVRYQKKAKNDAKLVSVMGDGYISEFGLNKSNKLSYVYILKTTDKKKAFALNIKLKAETEYKDSWVFSGRLGGNENDVAISKPAKPEPSNKKLDERPQLKIEDTQISLEIPKVDSSALVAKEEPKPAEPIPSLEGKPFIFKLADKDGKEVLGAAHVYESAKAGEYQSFKGNEIAYVPAPENKANTYLVKIQAAGYKKAEKIIQFGTFDSLKLDQKETIVEFQLVKVKSGDYIDFNEVHFMKNSALMTPTSQNELDGLATLMKENKKYKIKIHGFCNGVAKREIISRGSSTKFFELEPDKNKQQTKSANELSKERAEIVKIYLVEQGVESKRISVKAEGGDVPLYPEKGPLGALNDRVEIEVKSN